MIDDVTIAPPHAAQAEKAVLSVLMQHPELREEAPDLTPDHFYLGGNPIVFRRLQETPGGVELISFVQCLQDRGELEGIGGPAAIADIFSYAPNAAHFRTHLEIVREKFIRRQALILAGEIERTAREAESVQEIVSATSAPVTALHDLAAGSKPPKDTRAVLKLVMDELNDICSGRITPMGIETSLHELNVRFRGLHTGQAVVISGYPGGGKTTLGGQLAMDAAKEEQNTLICSLEMGEVPLMQRCIAYAAHLPGKAITDPLAYSHEVWKASAPTKQMLTQIKRAVMQIGELPFAIENLVGSNVHQIIAAIRRAHRKKPLRVVMVDFVQRIRSTPEMRKESREQQLAYASNQLADLSRELGFCLILPSQLNKEGAAKHAEAINEDADLHLQIVQDRAGAAPTFEHLGLAVIKDRHHGQSGELLPIVLDGPMIRFIPKPYEKLN